MGNKLKEEIILVHDQFDRGINKVIGKVEELGNKQSFGDIQKGFGSIQKGLNGLNGSFGTIIGSATKFAGALAGVSIGANLVDELQQAVTESVKLWQSSEGIILAFQRINQPGLLDKLREATHGTVDDVNLMKQAIKFKDFNLDINQLGTYLAFAQQKAKDTGESIDYMVDSIVTGLGRQSVQILDNLGISATEIRNKMKDGGDMTNAVAEIIKDRMQESGDYIETAADRAAARQAKINNQMVEMGQTFNPLIEQARTFWDEMKLGAYECLTYTARLFNSFSEFGRKTNKMADFGGYGTVSKLLARLGNGQTQGQRQMYKNQLAYFDDRINANERSLYAHKELKELTKKYGIDTPKVAKKKYERLMNEISSYGKKYGKKVKGARKNKKYKYYMSEDELKAENAALKDMRSSYKSSGALITADKPKFGGGGGSGYTPTYHSTKKVEYPVGSIGYYEDEISKLQQELKFQTNSDEIAKIKREIKDLQNKIDNLENPNPHLDVEVEDYRKQYGQELMFPKVYEKKKKEELLPTQEELDKLKIPSIFEQWSKQREDAQSNIDKVLESVNMGLIGRDKGKELIDGINSQLENKGIEPIEVDVDKTTTLSQIRGMLDSVGDLFTTMGESLEMPELNVVGVIAQSIANIIYGFSEAMKNPVNGVGGVFTWIAASVAGLAQLTAMISQIKSIGSYANGGIIGGNSFAGDNLIARVNSGEMILNTNHQRNLFDMLKYGTANGVNNNTVKFVIQGKDLFGVLSNYNNRTSKIR